MFCHRQVELSTERSRLALLYDSTSQPLPHLQPGQRHDFTVRHDIKDLVSGLPGALCCAVPVWREARRLVRLQGTAWPCLLGQLRRSDAQQTANAALAPAPAAKRLSARSFPILACIVRTFAQHPPYSTRSAAAHPLLPPGQPLAHLHSHLCAARWRAPAAGAGLLLQRSQPAGGADQGGQRAGWTVRQGPSTPGSRPRLPMRQPCLPPTCRGGPLTFERPFHSPHPNLGLPCMQQRQVGEAVLLEAALENATRDPMLLDTVTFLPSPGYTAERIGGGSSVAAEGSAGPLR